MDQEITDAPTDVDVDFLRRKCLEAREKGKPIKLHKDYVRAGWSGPLPLYMLWCEDCKLCTVTHPAGYGRITCKRCRYTERVSTPQRRRDFVYRPLIFLAPRLFLLGLMVAFIVLLFR